MARQISESAVTRLTAELEGLNLKLQQIKAEFETAQNATAAKNLELNKYSAEIKALQMVCCNGQVLLLLLLLTL